jgi:GNAT superfamily N-acetyltransferase
VLAQAFADDPLFGLVAGDADGRASGRRRLFELWDTELAELGCVWEIGDAEAAAVWIPPDRFESWARVDASTRPLTRKFIGEGVERWDAMWDWVTEFIPDEPLWFLDHIGVRPALQGTGLGRVLIELGLRAAVEDGVSAFLETAVASNIPY